MDETLEVVHDALDQQQVNPMLMDVVLDNLFGFCKFEDLADYRLVSKQWFNVSLKHWLKKAPILHLNLDDYTDTHEMIRYSKEVSQTMSGFLGVVHNKFHEYVPFEYAGLRKFQKFEIAGTDLSIHHQLLQNFLCDCGHWITDLRLELAFLDLDTYRAVMLSKMTPNLVHMQAGICFPNKLDASHSGYDINEQETHKKLISLEICAGEDPMDHGLPLPVIGWMQLFKRYPNLQSLLCGYNCSVRGQDVDRMLEAILTIRRADKKLLDLRRLGIYLDDHHQLTSLLPLLRDTRLTLDRLSFPLGSIGGINPNQTIHDILDTQRGSLKQLHVHRDNPLENFQPPTMNSLQVLGLGEWPFENLSILKGFPNIIAIKFFLTAHDTLHAVASTTMEEHLQGLVMTKLTSLECEYQHATGTMAIQDIGKLHRCIPHLTNLKLWLNNDTFRRVCECWPGLEHLHIVGNEVNDEGITGVIRGMEHRNPHNITSLQSLKSFIMTHEDEDLNDRCVSISHKSVAVLLLLPALEKVELTMDDDMDVDMTVLNTLEEKIKNCRVTFAGAIEGGGEQDTSEEEDSDESDRDTSEEEDSDESERDTSEEEDSD